VFPAGQGDMQSLFEQAAQLQQQVMAAQEELAETEVEGSAGGGLVTATVTGTGELVRLDIKPEAADPDDTETLADLVVAAVRDASANAQDLAASKLGPLAGGLGGLGDLGQPGDLGGPGGLQLPER
jgi:DNA-binding YbaB/EbfC family protein